MRKHAFKRHAARGGKPITGALLLATLTIPFYLTAHGEGFESYYPANELLRRTIQGVWESQAFRHPPGLGQQVREALQSINEVEGRTDPVAAGLLSTRLKGAWTELEQARAIHGLGYNEFDEATFYAADAQFQEVVTQFQGSRSPYSAERYQMALQALSQAEALAKNARRAVPGLSSDDVLLMREKRQRLLLKEAEGGAGLTPQFGIEAIRSR